MSNRTTSGSTWPERETIDFGVAKTDEFSITGAGFTCTRTMAPEQVRGDKPTLLVDITVWSAAI